MPEETSFVALVPMKGHSERIPGKNLRELCGRPLCHWVLETLSRIGPVAEVVVNTDSPEIAASVREAFEVTVHERPEDLRGDGVPMNDVLRHDVERLPEAELFVQTHATNPLLTAETLERALRRFLEPGDHDSLFGVTRHQARFYDARGAPLNHDPGRPLLRTQDLPPVYEDNSNFYVFSRDTLAASGRRVGEQPVLFEVEPLEAVDIDEPEDWRLAELLLRDRLERRDGR